MAKLVMTALVTAMLAMPSAGAAQPAAGVPMPDPCALLTKDDVQKATGQSDVLRFPSKAEKMPAGEPYCTIDGGLYDIELIVYPRAAPAPLGTPKDGEALAGVGAGAYVRSTPGSMAVFAIGDLSSPYAVQVGLQSQLSPKEMQPVAVALVQAALARLK